MKSIGAMRLDAEFLRAAKENANVIPDTWQCIATDYSARSLTVSSDKLPALAGIARRFQERSGDEYLAGIWKKSPLDDLLWANEGRYKSYYPPRPKSEKFPEMDLAAPAPGKPIRYGAPSWSWTAVDGAVRWLLATENRTGEYFAKILDYNVMCKGLDVSGGVTDGYLTLRAPLYKIPTDVVSQLLPGQNHYPYIRFEGIFSSVVVRMDVPGKVDVSEEQAMGSVRYPNLFILVIKESGALILESDGERLEDDSPRPYKRVGVIADSYNLPRWNRSDCVEATCRIY
jgi:hypothetical protein